MSRHFALLVAALCLAACDDPFVAPTSVPYVPPPVNQSELVLFVGDTVDMSGQLDVTSEQDLASCSTDDRTIAAIDGTIRVVGESAGDVTISCTRSTPIDTFVRDDLSAATQMSVYYYAIVAHVRERDEGFAQ